MIEEKLEQGNPSLAAQDPADLTKIENSEVQDQDSVMPGGVEKKKSNLNKSAKSYFKR